MLEFLFPAVVTVLNPGGPSPQRMVTFYRSLLAYERTRDKEAFYFSWEKEMVLLGALGEEAPLVPASRVSVRRPS